MVHNPVREEEPLRTKLELSGKLHGCMDCAFRCYSSSEGVSWGLAKKKTWDGT
jgi:hypothetical protein